jgi:hypothetical protein
MPALIAPSPITAMLVGDREAQRRRDRGRRMRRAERIVLALAALGEARQPTGLAQRADAVAPAGQDLVRIGLMANVPHQLVVGGVEDIVNRYRQLDYAQPRTEVSAGRSDHRNHL